MDALLIEGPNRLQGSVAVSGSKNSCLPLLFSSLLFDDELEFENVPRLWDVETTLKILSLIGTRFEWNKESGRLWLYPKIANPIAPYEWVRKMRASILALGPLLAKCGHAQVSLPGGCAIGARPVNYHINAMKKMGVRIVVENGYIHATIPSKLTGCEIVFPDITVTGTENLLMLACRADGQTVIRNAAREPEVVALGKFLIDCGVKIEGLGSSTITVEGGGLHKPQKTLMKTAQKAAQTPPQKTPIAIPPDRIETGTWIAASMVTRSPLTITRTDASILTATIDAFRAMGVIIDISDNQTTLRVTPSDHYSPIHIETSCYPGFPTDMQAQAVAALCLAKGKSSVRETIFENRFMHIAELRRLGAQIDIDDNLATIHGPTELRGAPIMATDLRASASLVIAALAATGETKLSRIYHLDRGYQYLDRKLAKLGARVLRIKE